MTPEECYEAVAEQIKKILKEKMKTEDHFCMELTIYRFFEDPPPKEE